MGLRNHMSNGTFNKRKSTAKPLSITLCADTEQMIRSLARAHRLPITQVLRLSILNGLSAVEKKLSDPTNS
jgi:hypothetical protein